MIGRCLIQNAIRQGNLELGRGYSRGEPLEQEGIYSPEVVYTGPPTIRSVANHRIKPRQLDILELSVGAFHARGVAQLALAQGIRNLVNPPDIAEVQLHAEDVDSLGVLLPVIVVVAAFAGSRLQGLARAGGVLGVGAKRVDGL